MLHTYAVKRWPLVFGAVLTLGSRAVCQSDRGFISNAGTIGYVAAGLALPLVREGASGAQHSLRVLDALATTGLLTEGLKRVTRVRRPDSNDRDSFPSLHSSLAFSVATLESQFHPQEAPLWFTGASVIAYERVRIKRHHWTDVLAGAALGFGTARLELSSHRGLVLYPVITDNGGVTMILTTRF